MTDHTIVLHDHDKSPDDLVAEAIAELKTEVEFSNLRLAYLKTHVELHDLSEVFWVEYHRYLTTHLAEFEEHKLEPTSWTEGVIESWGCFKCETYTPCDFATTKAKRLLGVSE